MTNFTSLFSPMRPGRAIAGLALGILLAGCGNHDSSGTGTLAKVDACALVSAAMIQQFSPGLGAGHLSSVVHPSNVSTCVWEDRTHHLLALMLTVGPADPAGVVKGLEQGFGANMGYRFVSVAGLGDEAATAIQKADPGKGLAPGVAIFDIRVGRRQLVFSPMRPPISGLDTPAFKRLRRLAAEVIVRLGTSHAD